MVVEQFHEGCHVGRTATGPQLGLGASAVEHPDRFPGGDLEDPAGGRIVRAPHLAPVSDLDGPETASLQFGNARMQGAGHEHLSVEHRVIRSPQRAAQIVPFKQARQAVLFPPERMDPVPALSSSPSGSDKH